MSYRCIVNTGVTTKSVEYLPFRFVGFSCRALRKISDAVVAAIALDSLNNVSFSCKHIYLRKMKMIQVYTCSYLCLLLSSYMCILQSINQKDTTTDLFFTLIKKPFSYLSKINSWPQTNKLSFFSETVLWLQTHFLPQWNPAWWFWSPGREAERWPCCVRSRTHLTYQPGP